MGVEGADSDAVTAPGALVKRKQIVAVKREAGALHTRFPTHDHKRTRTRDTHDDYRNCDGETALYTEERRRVPWLTPRPSLAPSSAVADCDLALGMSLLRIDDALCHWLARHNVTIDFLEDREAWPSQVADVAGLLAMGDGSRAKPSAPEDEAQARHHERGRVQEAAGVREGEVHGHDQAGEGHGGELGDMPVGL